MTDYAKAAADIADNQRAALALVRAMRDESYDDAATLLQITCDMGSACYVMITLAKIIASNVDKQWVNRKLEECNEMDLSGVFERFVRTRECREQED
jgi:hypothetical protein